MASLTLRITKSADAYGSVAQSYNVESNFPKWKTESIPSNLHGINITNVDFTAYYTNMSITSNSHLVLRGYTGTSNGDYTLGQKTITGQGWITIPGTFQPASAATKPTWANRIFDYAAYNLICFSVSTPGATVQSELSSTAPYVALTYIPQPFTLSELYPNSSSVAPRSVDNRFGWTLSPTFNGLSADAQYGDVTQNSCVLEWRYIGDSAVNSVNIGVSGVSGYVDIPANTFTASAVEWRVIVTSNMGATATSDWMAVNTDDTLSSAEIVSPTGSVIEDVTGVHYEWNHIIETGTPQAGFNIQTSVDQGSTWANLAEMVGADESYTAPHNATPTGAIMWRVRTKNTTGEYGSWSAPASIIVVASPDVPNIVYVDTKPRITIRWQSANQQAYRVVYGPLDAPIYDSGMVFSTNKEFRISFYLDDGTYVVHVQIQNDSGLISSFATVQTDVVNLPGEIFRLTAKSQYDCALLFWDALSDAINYYVERDGVPIGLIPTGGSTQFADYLCRGLHAYRVRAVDANDYYTMSNTVTEKSLPLYGMLVPVDMPDDWLLLKWTRDGGETHNKSGGHSKEYVTYQGRDKPVVYASKAKAETVQFSYRFCEREAFERLERLDGETVMYKNWRGDYYFGTLDSVSSYLGKYSDVGFSIVLTEYSEVVGYV